MSIHPNGLLWLPIVLDGNV